MATPSTSILKARLANVRDPPRIIIKLFFEDLSISLFNAYFQKESMNNDYPDSNYYYSHIPAYCNH